MSIPDPLIAIKARWSAATPGPWTSGGPVDREKLTGSFPRGLTSQVYEIGQEGDELPPGIAVVNNYLRVGEGAEPDWRWTAETNAAAIAAAPEDVAWLIAEVERLRRGC